jgi:hypothetical protein
MTSEKKESVSSTRNKFTPSEQAWMMKEIADRYFEGARQSDIADELSKIRPEKPITQQLVSYYLKKLQKLWMAEAAIKIDAAKARELAKIDNLERTYWKAWKKSLGPQKVKEATKDGKEESASVKEYDSTGDHRFLDGVQWCIKQRREILGLDAPKKINAMTFDGKIDWASCSLEQVTRLRMGENPLDVLRPDQIK